MPDKRIDELPELTTLSDNCLFIVEGGDNVTYKITAANMASYFGGGGGGGGVTNAVLAANGSDYIALVDGTSFLAQASP